MGQKKDGGICRFCLKEFAGSAMGRHLISCKSKKEKDKQEIGKNGFIYHMKITGGRPYWLHLEANSDIVLAELDQFLRDIWLECCGHLSLFKIKGIHYVNDLPDYLEPEEEPMNFSLSEVFNPKDKFEYIYDFGSTTWLTGQVYAVHEGKLKRDIRILARNDPPEFTCVSCGSKATHICLECDQEFCHNCLDKHKSGEGMELPIVNSPRTGICGYGGENDHDYFQISTNSI